MSDYTYTITYSNGSTTVASGTTYDSYTYYGYDPQPKWVDYQTWKYFQGSISGNRYRFRLNRNTRTI